MIKYKLSYRELLLENKSIKFPKILKQKMNTIL